MNVSSHSLPLEGSTRFDEQPTLGANAIDVWAMLPSTKLRPPKLPLAVLTRPELLARIHQWRARRLSIVVAPAGYGKTTLAASVLPTTPPATDAPPGATAGFYGWLALDEDDDTPTRFVQALAASLITLIPETARAATVLALTQEEPQRALLLLLAALEKLTAPVLLVLDNCHRLQNSAVHDLLDAALEYTPNNVHWLLLARRRLPISLGRLRLQRQVLELSADDLRLDRSEILAFLQLNHVYTADAEVIELIEARTQGWLAGLQLALLSLLPEFGAEGNWNRESGETEALRTLFEQLSGDKMLVAEYLAGEVLAQLNEPLRSFLLRCAILEQLNPRLCTAVTGVEDSEHLLRAAVQQQLFLRPLDDTGEWYEQHHLFRDFLLHHLRMAESTANVQLLYRRAANWYVTHGDMVAGLRALLTGGHSQLAAELVQSRAQAALLNNYLAELQQWFELLPQDEIDARPRLLLDLTWLSLMRSVSFVTTFQHTSTLLAALPPLPKPWQDELTALTFMYRLHVGPRQRLHDDALMAVQDFEPSSFLARGWTHIVAGLLIDQAPDKQMSNFTEAADAAFRAAGFSYGRIYTLELQAHADLLNAQVESVLRNSAQILDLMARQSRPNPSDRASVNFTVGEALYWQNRLPAASTYFQQAWRDAMTYQDSGLLLQVHAVAKLLNLADGEEILTLSLDPDIQAYHWKQTREFNPLHTRAMLVLWELRYGIACGAPQLALREFDALGITIESLPMDAPDLMWLALLTAYVTKGAQLEQITPGFELMLGRAHSISSPYLKIQVNILQARRLHQLGRRNAARGVMRQLLHDVEASGYVRMILDQPELLPLLQLAGSDYARWLMTKMLKPTQPATTTGFSSREEKILALLAEGLSTAQLAEHLVLTASTTRSYLSRLYAKMGVKNHTQATTWARDHWQK